MKFDGLIIGKNYDPYYNLAREEALFNEKKSYIVLWQNEPSVIIGRHQNSLQETDDEFLCKNKIPLVRRMTGGGAVYHDLGNVNVSFFFDCKGTEFEINVFWCMSMILEFLKENGVNAYLSGRNDICMSDINGMERKISGCAMMQRGNRGMLHATLLYSADMEMMEKALTPANVKLESKGIASVKARVTNIRESIKCIEDEDDFLTKAAGFFAKGTFAERITDSFCHDKTICLMDERYKTWEWNYGRNPECKIFNSKKFPIGTVELNLKVNNGIIAECSFAGDYIDVHPLAYIERALSGVEYRRGSIEKVLMKFNCIDYWGIDNINDILDFFMEGEI